MSMYKNSIKIIATFFYIGNVPVAPGTLASIAGALISIAVFQNIILYLVILALVLAAGFYASGKSLMNANQVIRIL